MMTRRLRPRPTLIQHRCHWYRKGVDVTTVTSHAAASEFALALETTWFSPFTCSPVNKYYGESPCPIGTCSMLDLESPKVPNLNLESICLESIFCLHILWYSACVQKWHRAIFLYAFINVINNMDLLQTVGKWFHSSIFCINFQNDHSFQSLQVSIGSEPLTSKPFLFNYSESTKAKKNNNSQK